MDRTELAWNTSDYDTSYWDDEFENGTLIRSHPTPKTPPLAKKRTQFKTLPKTRFDRPKSPPFAAEKSKSRRKSYSAFLQKISERKKPSAASKNMPNGSRHFSKSKSRPKPKPAQENKTPKKEPKPSVQSPNQSRNTPASLFKTASKYFSKLFDNGPNSETNAENRSKQPRSPETTAGRRKSAAASAARKKKAERLLLKAIKLIGEKKLLKTFVDHLGRTPFETGKNGEKSKNGKKGEKSKNGKKGKKSKKIIPPERLSNAVVSAVAAENSGSTSADAVFAQRRRELAAESEATRGDCAAAKQQLADLTLEFQRLNAENESLRGENFRLRVDAKDGAKKRAAGDKGSAAGAGKGGGGKAPGEKRAAEGRGKVTQRKQRWYAAKLEKWKRENAGHNEIELREVKERLKEWWRGMSLAERRDELFKEDWE